MNFGLSRAAKVQSFLVVVLGIGCVPADGPQALSDVEYLRLLAAEDARATTEHDLNVLVEATANEAPFARGTAVRALGRLQRPEVIENIIPLLSDSVASVRTAATNAVAQAYHTSTADDVVSVLVGRATEEADPEVRGALAQALGRLDVSPTSRPRLVETLVALSASETGDAPTSTLSGVLLGFEALVRRGGGEALNAEATQRLHTLTTYQGSGPSDLDASRIRTLSISTLAQAQKASRELWDRALSDTSPAVRATATRSLNVAPPSQRITLIDRALSDTSPRTVIEALGQLARLPRSAENCAHLLAAASPPSTAGVRVIAIDALGQPCPERAEQVFFLRDVANALPDAGGSAWQPSAHALLSLTQISPAEAIEALPAFREHGSPFVRAYAARAAHGLSRVEDLRALSGDLSANVRSIAIEGLFEFLGHDIDETLIGQLADDDPQLLMTVARLLAGSPAGERAATESLGAFERISEAQRETWRDSRRALLERVADLGGPALTDRMTPFLSDYDPLVAQDVANILESWNDRPYEAIPLPLPRSPLPTASELRSMDGASVILHMEGGGTIEITLDPYGSTTNTYRFARLVREGYFDGLTFHRWVPNFVLQGGSPGANEYYGDAQYSRDEVSALLHWRGTVGISTRGHDTGDGQLFFNLIDNVRLNHDYTIVGSVTSGMPVVDAALEGATIERAEVRPAT
jgi:cyclophilin family peptidyl-prolyl cis-trans isomerase/HEAT repeat protein